MKRFKDAYQYLHNTDEKSIAKRIAIIGAFLIMEISISDMTIS